VTWARPRFRRLRRALSDDRGAGPLEFVIIAPGVLLLLLASLQIAMWYIARSTAQTAAREAVRAERVYGAADNDGTLAADRYLSTGGDWLTHTGVTVTRSPTDVTVTVTGNALTLLPFVHVTATASDHGTIERFTTDSQP
jgi:Flp pilus assembly protein TadG